MGTRIVILAASLGFAFVAEAQTPQARLCGPFTFVAGGASEASCPGPASGLTLLVRNGRSDGSRRATSARLRWNGVELAGPQSFGGHVSGLVRAVDAAAANVVRVELASGEVTVEVLRLADACFALEPQQVPRASGSPAAQMFPFARRNAFGDYWFIAEVKRLASGSVTLNGASLLAPRELSAQVSAVVKPLTLADDNVLAVNVTARPDAAMTVQILDYDGAAPVFALTSHTDGQTVESPVVTLAGTIDDPSATLAAGAASGAATAGGTFSVAGVSLHPGPNTVRVVATDPCGNTSELSLTLIFDSSPPALSVLAPADGLLTTQPVLAITLAYSDPDPASGVDPGSLDVRVNGTSVAMTAGATGATGTHTFPEGESTLTVSLGDHAGNVTTRTVTVHVDTLGPAIALAGVSPTSDSMPALDASFHDQNGAGLDLATLEAFVDGRDVTAELDLAADPEQGVATWTATEPLSDGAHLFVVRLADLAGNLGEATLAVVVDIEPPVLHGVSPGSYVTSSQVVVEGFVDDATATTVTVQGEPAIVEDGRFRAGPLTLGEGETPINIRAEDAVGHVVYKVFGVSVDTLAPVLNLAPSDGILIADAAPAILATYSDAGIGVDDASLTATLDGAELFFSAGQNQATSIAYDLGDGEHVVRAAITDRLGNRREAEARFRVDNRAPRFSDLQPADGGATSSATVTVSGAVDDPNLTTVSVAGVPTAVMDARFSAVVELLEGGNTIVIAGSDLAGNTATAELHIERDSTPPVVVFTAPAPGLVNTSPITVTGTVTDANPIVQVIVGAQAVELDADGAFSASVALESGVNPIAAMAKDAVGNVGRATLLIELGRLRPPELTLSVSEPTEGAFLEGPYVRVVGAAVGPSDIVSLTVGGDAVELAPIEFGAAFDAQVAVPDGLVRLSFIATDSAGHLTVLDRTFVVLPPPPEFAPGELSGVGVPTHLTMVSGDHQAGVAGQPLSLPLTVRVTDGAGDPVAGVEVVFSGFDGGSAPEPQAGLVMVGSSTALVATGISGEASVHVRLGTEHGINGTRFLATFAGNNLMPAFFQITVLPPAEPGADTRFEGRVMDETFSPIDGVTLTLQGTDPELSAVSDHTGWFGIGGIAPGEYHLLVTGATANTAARRFPILLFDEVTVLEGQVNELKEGVIFLPNLVHGTAVTLTGDETEVRVIEPPDIPGFSLEIAPGSATFHPPEAPEGTKHGTVSVTQVPADRTPMAMPGGLYSSTIVTIQPSHVRFSPPARVTFPNRDGLPPGTRTPLMSYDHDLGKFVAIGQGTVSEDGSLIISDAGVGVVKGGWHCQPDPIPPLTTVVHGLLKCKGATCKVVDKVTTSQDFVVGGTAPNCVTVNVPVREDIYYDCVCPPCKKDSDCGKAFCAGGSERSVPKCVDQQCTVTTEDCADDNECTDDACNNGKCLAPTKKCDDGQKCTEDTCDPTTGCEFTPKDCDDQNGCTNDSCNGTSGQCKNDPCDEQKAPWCQKDKCNDAGTGCTTEEYEDKGEVEDALSFDVSKILTIFGTLASKLGITITPKVSVFGKLNRKQACCEAESTGDPPLFKTKTKVSGGLKVGFELFDVPVPNLALPTKSFTIPFVGTFNLKVGIFVDAALSLSAQLNFNYSSCGGPQCCLNAGASAAGAAGIKGSVSLVESGACECEAPKTGPCCAFGKACGNGCISRLDTCSEPSGSACDAPAPFRAECGAQAGVKASFTIGCGQLCGEAGFDGFTLGCTFSFFNRLSYSRDWGPYLPIGTGNQCYDYSPPSNWCQ